MAKLKYRILYNQDCTDLFYVTKEPVTPGHVDRMVDEVAGSGVDVMLINPNAQRVNYPSRVWQTFWDGYAPGRPEFFGPVPPNDIPKREAFVTRMQGLADQGCDYLQHALSRCRKDGIAPGITIRMNDMHDVPWPGSHLFSRFYLEHPEFRLASPARLGWGATGLNYAHAGVREHYLALVDELLERYDFDVLELDFLRFVNYFPRDGAFEKWADVMSGFLRDVRKRLARSARTIALIPRVAPTPAAAYELGFDVGRWAREELVDGLTIGHFFNTGWNMPIDALRGLVGADVAIFACAEYAADRRQGLPVRFLPTDPDILRGFASGQLASGADGIALFNFFCSRESDPAPDPSFAAIADLASLHCLRGKSKTCMVTADTSCPETDAPTQVPVALGPGRSQAFEMALAAEPAGTGVEVVLAFSGAASAETLWLRFNQTPVGHAGEVCDEPQGQGRVKIARFPVPEVVLKDGRNHLVVRNESGTITVLGIDVRVHDRA